MVVMEDRRTYITRHVGKFAFRIQGKLGPEFSFRWFRGRRAGQDYKRKGQEMQKYILCIDHRFPWQIINRIQFEEAIALWKVMTNKEKNLYRVMAEGEKKLGINIFIGEHLAALKIGCSLARHFSDARFGQRSRYYLCGFFAKGMFGSMSFGSCFIRIAVFGLNSYGEDFIMGI